MGQTFSAEDISPTPGKAQYSADEINKSGGFFSALGDSLKAQGSKLVSNITDPHLPTGDFLKSWVKDSGDLLDKAKASADQKDYGSAAAHGFNFLVNVVPGLGKAMDDAAEKISQADELYDKDPAAAHDLANQALGTLTGTVLPARYGPEAAKLAGKAIVGTAKAAAAIPGVVRAVAASPDAAGIARDALGVVSPRAMHAASAVGRVIRVGGKIADALSGPEQPLAEAPPEVAAPEVPAAPAPPAIDTSQIPSLDDIAKQLGAKDFKSLGQAGRDVVQKYQNNFIAKQASTAAPASATATNGLPLKPPETPAATMEPPGAAGQEVSALLKEIPKKTAAQEMADKFMKAQIRPAESVKPSWDEGSGAMVEDSPMTKSYHLATQLHEMGVTADAAEDLSPAAREELAQRAVKDKSAKTSNVTALDWRRTITKLRRLEAQSKETASK